jgi:hypothetical protein
MIDGSGVQLVRWLANGERGGSSNAIVTYLAGIPASVWWSERAHPRDPDDLVRCLKLLWSVPELAPRLPEMASASRQWAALIAIWPELCRTLDEEVPDWQTSQRWSAPRTYALMRDALRGEEAR